MIIEFVLLLFFQLTLEVRKVFIVHAFLFTFNICELIIQFLRVRSIKREKFGETRNSCI